VVSCAAVYARISSDRDGLQLGVRRQVEDCQALAARLGWTVGELYTDDDVSAYSGKRRPAYERMLEDLKAGDRDAVLAYDSDRLHRRPVELEAFIVLCEAQQVALATCQGELDLATADGRFKARIMGAVASKESDDKSRRVTRKHEELAKAGKVSGGGTRPFGYSTDRLRVNKAEAAVVRDLAKRALAGESLRSMANDLNEREIPTSTGGLWTSTTLKRVLVSARIAGQREHRGEIVAKAEWPAIITPAQSTRLRALLRDPERRTSRPVRRYLLVGLLRCGKCGSVLVSRPRDDGSRRYVCAKGPGLPGCGGVTILADDLEVFVTEAVLYRLDSPQMGRVMTGARNDDEKANVAIAELADAHAHADELAEAYANKQIGMRDWLTAKAPIERRITAAQKRLGRLQRTTVLDDYVGNSRRLRKQWDSLNLDRQRAIVAAVLDHLDIGPAVLGRNTFDPKRVKPIWRR
jgi:site-specific DNA recombinase